MIQLREYQTAALDALEADWEDGLSRIGVSAATGTGKTVIMSHLAHRYVQRGMRVLILVHRDDLVRQTVDKLVRIDNSVSIGVVQANRNSAGARIVVASVQTACRPKRLAQLGKFGLIICDEAHRSVAKQWTDVLDGLGAMELDTPVRCAGFSATWTRADGRALSEVWQKISFELPIEWAIEQGFLVRPRGQYIRTDIRLDELKKTAGDYNAGDLGKKLSRDSVRDAIVAGYLEHAADRSGVVFAPTVDTAEFFKAGFEAAGITSEGLYGITSRSDSLDIQKRHKHGDTQVLISCTKLSEGWDAPWVSAGVIARPTVHEGLFIQMVGRLLRLHESKRDAVILDPTGVLFRHKLGGVIDLDGSLKMDDEDELDEDEDELDEPSFTEPAEGIDAMVSGYQSIELLNTSYLLTYGGIPFSHEGISRCRFIIGPDQHPYPWYSVGQMHIDGKGEWVQTRLTLEQATAMLRSRHETPAPILRLRTATRRQRSQAAIAGVTPPRGRISAGDLFDQVQTAVFSRLLDSVPSWS